jgi:hypothetical protein
MHVPEIIEVKEHLDRLKSEGLVQEWELPYENILTRRSAAIFFLNLAEGQDAETSKVWSELERYSNFSTRDNSEQKLSKLKHRITFSLEEKEKNAARKLQTAN